MDHNYIILISVAIAAVGGILNWRKRISARNWPMVTGVVEQTCVDRTDRGYVPGILYSYQVNGEFYSGQYSFGKRYVDPDKAVELAKPWLQKKILIRYKPGDPQISVLLPDDPPA